MKATDKKVKVSGTGERIVFVDENKKEFIRNDNGTFQALDEVKIDYEIFPGETPGKKKDPKKKREKKEASVVPEEMEVPVVGGLVPITPRGLTDAVVMPVISAVEAAEMMKQYQELTKAVLDPSDYQKMGNRAFKKKSAWRKYAKVFNLSDEIIDEKIIRDNVGRIIEAKYVVKVTAPNGRYATGIGSCSMSDKAHDEDKLYNGKVTCKGPCDGRKHFNNPNHDIPSTAHTRAKNRGISDLTGSGEVSAEEMR